MAKNPTEQPPPAQIERFREAARELRCDESEERFDAALVKVAKAPPKSSQSKARAAKRSDRHND